ncbi:MAG: zinc ribbon domain-containing protein [Deltaproteobacteria bacterium]|nr:zinc ribbon domain-containing protein [Deltaproteobacteria bacterium]
MRMIMAPILALVVVFALTGCKLEYWAKINADLSGKSSVKVLTMGLVTKKQLEDDIKKRGIANYSISEFVEEVDIGKGKMEPIPGIRIDLNWNTVDEFIKAFSVVRRGLRDPFVKNADGTITVNLGVVSDSGTTTIETEGSIISTTKGAKVNGSTVVFAPFQQVKLTFKPSAGFPIVPIAVGAGILIFGAIAFFVVKNKKSDDPDPLDIDGKEVSLRTAPTGICDACGKASDKNDAFCHKCGKKLQ